MATVLIEVRHIQDFIFESSRLSQIRGASRLLREFDDMITGIVEEHGGNPVVAHGAHLVAEVPNQAVHAFEGNVREAYRRIFELEPTDLVVASGRDYAAASRHASQQRSGVAPIGLPHHLVRPCAVCRKRAAQMITDLEPGTTARTCRVCRQRQDASVGPLSGWESSSNSVTGFAEVHGSSRIGVLMADGDGVGSRMANLAEWVDRHSLSDGLERATTSGVAAMAKLVAERRGWSSTRGETDAILPLWIGGDDCTVLLPADLALECAEVFAQGFSRVMDPFAEKYALDHFTCSAGLVIARASHPMHDIVELAGQLRDGAKSAMRDSLLNAPADRRAEFAGALDFEVVTGSVAGSLVERRSRSNSGPLLIAREASGGDPRTLQRWLQDARQLVQRDAPRGRIRNLGDAQTGAADIIGGVVDADARKMLSAALEHNRLDTLREIYEVVR